MSNAASILKLGGFAPLREIAPLEGMEEFFTQRRQGAKGELKTEEALTSILSHQERKKISVPNLSVFA